MVKASVFTGVYNRAKIVHETIESILAQTMDDFQYIIVDDASDDETYEVCKSYNDPRIKIIRNPINLGISANFNIAYPYFKGDYIFMQDSDDVARPHRLKTQCDFMDSHPDISVLGAAMQLIVEGREELNTILSSSETHEKILMTTLFGPFLYNPTICYRKDFLDKTGVRFNHFIETGNERDFWIRCIFESGDYPVRFHALKDVLVDYYRRKNSIGLTSKQHNGNGNDLMNLYILNKMGILFSEEEFACHHYLCTNQLDKLIGKYDIYCAFLEKIALKNREKTVFPLPIFEQYLVKVLYRVAKVNNLPSVVFFGQNYIISETK